MPVSFTVKVNWNELPLLVFGSSDSNRHSHPYDVAETSQDGVSSENDLILRMTFGDFAKSKKQGKFDFFALVVSQNPPSIHLFLLNSDPTSKKNSINQLE
ncbi:unnamed protein product [Didymodactylos carnosus]|uniref:Uncharacterized protein n=1 Tax=Didymodactylos carnosus TaxID=1234261 RepID=A0A8S2I075_9BILA|nr:unnamed protein product [Didymodactylos carnosus]CAF3698045.1 unnamed protein product [Didymodactylos carnosus]